MLRDNRLRLVTLGRLTLVGSSGEEHESLAKRRRKLALLAVLAMARRPIARDTLVEMFWGAEDEARARHSLSNALSSLRRALGAAAIRSRDADVAVAADAPLIVDALELGDAVEGREFGRATGLYAGPFLEGFFLDDSPTFDQWMSRERRRLEGLFVQACAQECAMLARARRWSDGHALARRWLDTQPLSPDAALMVLNTARAPGTRAALAQALEDYETLKSHLEREFDLPPEAAVRTLAEQIREQLATVEPEPARRSEEATPAPAVAEAAAVAVVPDTSPFFPPLPDTVTGTWASPPTRRSRRRPTIWGVVGGLVVIGAVALATWLSGKPRVADPTVDAARRPVVAVLAMRLRASDSSLGWLAGGLSQMIVGKLSHNTAIDVVPVAQVRAVMVRSGHLEDAQLADETARDLARRIGATLEVRGTIVRDAGNLVLDMTVHDVGTGTLVRSAVVSQADPLSLADEAAVRILSAANIGGGPGGAFVGLETPSLEAYQHYTQFLDDAARGHQTEAIHELDAAIALDSGFVAALRNRIGYAIANADTALTRRLRETLRRHADRASDFDRMDEEAEAAYYAGEHERAEALARALHRRWPHDPRTYLTLVTALSSHGKNEEAKQVAREGIALDSLAVAAGNGPCGPCLNYGGLIGLYEGDGDFRGAADWARRWIRVQPDAASAWESLAWTYAYTQQPDSALLLIRRAMSLAGGDLWVTESLAHMLLVSRRYAAADSVISGIESLGAARLGIELETVADLRSALARERGRFRESNDLLKRYVKGPGGNGFANLMMADNMRWLGGYAAASHQYDSFSHPPLEHFALPIPAASARAFCWMHALAADAYAPTGDTLTLLAMADTLERGCGRSWYARDWRLYHYVRGQIAVHGHRYAEAEREFTQSIWSRVEGWTPIFVALAGAQSAQGHPHDAIATLRSAYATRLDAMGRYVPISQIDFHMSRAFAQAGEKDSARVYAEYVRTAWRDADPEIRRQLAQLP